jgi:iron-sulfur cluster assembly protein
LLAWGASTEPTRKEVSALLALTDTAVEAVKNIVSSSDEGSETSGLRLVAERTGEQANFQLSVVPLPAEDDEVIEAQGARVFLEPEAASLLDDKVLDASVEQNQVAFTIADQIEE